MSFRLVSKSVTLNDLERRNAGNGRFLRYSSDFGSFQHALHKSGWKIYLNFLRRNIAQSFYFFRRAAMLALQALY